MAKRMWRISQPPVETEGKRGMFDLAYGTQSEKQKLDLWFPEEGEEPFPLILSIHGGGFIACDKRNGEMIKPMLAGLKKGYAVAGINYRLSDECCFPEQIRDIRRCIRFIRAHAQELRIDPERMVLWGGSAGGYLALMGALCENEELFDTPDDENRKVSARVSGCVAWYPLVDVSSAEQELKINSVLHRFTEGPSTDVSEEYEEALPVLESDEFPFYEAKDGIKPRLLGAYDGTGREKLADAKQYLHPDIPPVFIQHGSRDEMVPVQQSIQFALRAEEICGKGRVSLEIIPEAIHSSVLFETSENIEKVLAFVEKIMHY